MSRVYEPLKPNCFSVGLFTRSATFASFNALSQFSDSSNFLSFF